jgi:ankyrin repeat protein
MELITIPSSSFVENNGRQYSNQSYWWKSITNNNLNSEKPLEFESSADIHAKLILGSVSSPIDNFGEENGTNVIGETILHIAIVYDDLVSIKILVEQKHYNVNQRNSGGKILNGFSSKETSKLIKQCKYDRLAYYGEYSLALAAYFGNKGIYDYLIEKGADPNLRSEYVII